MLTLENERFLVSIDPDRGGSVAGFRFVDGPEILRPARWKTAPDATDSACFPMVPFCNRIRDNRFVFAGREVTLPPNTRDGKRVAHGFGWRASWKVIECSSVRAVLEHDHAPAAWPWRYRAWEEFAIDDHALTIRLGIVNDDCRAMPVGLGLHPYFPLSATTRLGFTAESCHALDELGFPVPAADADVTLADAASGALSPHIGNRYFGGVTGDVLIGEPETGLRIRLSASPACTDFALHVEPENGLFCFEPMTHAVDAFAKNADYEDVRFHTLLPSSHFAICVAVSHIDPRHVQAS